ncbi:hypothetical protein [Rhodococcus sp. JS3073]|uniref:hypothetical protein n=1 Tax=Rhodococcus sp. JS3073 TaxID=3002901 RepID=UPI002285D578|nr:hypothetical protein [Rhodococcus sp. JS3073]WAM19500.1 hypothetical protein OYT95_38110 [Rhodococcus sp. JS3073]
MTYDELFTNITVRDQPWPPKRQRAETGCLYVVEFDSGWVKVGQTTTWPTRRGKLVTDFGDRYGWRIIRHWQSTPVSALRLEATPRSELGDLEIRLKEFARQPDGVSVFSDQLPNRGRRVCGAGETETFSGRSFGDLVAYADVLALCSTPVRHKRS